MLRRSRRGFGAGIWRDLPFLDLTDAAVGLPQLLPLGSIYPPPRLTRRSPRRRRRRRRLPPGRELVPVQAVRLRIPPAAAATTRPPPRRAAAGPVPPRPVAVGAELPSEPGEALGAVHRAVPSPSIPARRRRRGGLLLLPVAVVVVEPAAAAEALPAVVKPVAALVLRGAAPRRRGRRRGRALVEPALPVVGVVRVVVSVRRRPLPLHATAARGVRAKSDDDDSCSWDSRRTVGGWRSQER